MGDGGDLVAMLVVIRNAPKREFFPEIEAAQLDARALFDVPVQQADQRRLRVEFPPRDEIPAHLCTRPPLQSANQFSQQGHVRRENFSKMSPGSVRFDAW